MPSESQVVHEVTLPSWLECQIVDPFTILFRFKIAGSMYGQQCTFTEETPDTVKTYLVKAAVARATLTLLRVVLNLPNASRKELLEEVERCLR